jgi:hypothetical protein
MGILVFVQPICLLVSSIYSDVLHLQNNLQSLRLVMDRRSMRWMILQASAFQFCQFISRDLTRACDDRSGHEARAAIHPACTPSHLDLLSLVSAILIPAAISLRAECGAMDIELTMNWGAAKGQRDESWETCAKHATITPALKGRASP